MEVFHLDKQKATLHCWLESLSNVSEMSCMYVSYFID